VINSSLLLVLVVKS